MKLASFRVTNFRSVDDSGWISTADVTALIGTNESGKTNLLLPLWKLNPANDGEIKLLTDSPRKRYNELRSLEDAEKPSFIHAKFDLDEDEIAAIVEITKADPAYVKQAEVTRRFDGKFTVGFPYERVRTVEASRAKVLFDKTRAELERAEPAKTEEALKQKMLKAIATCVNELESYGDQLSKTEVNNLSIEIAAVNTEGAVKRSTITPHFGQLSDGVAELLAEVSIPAPSDFKDARNYVANNLPKFVYYSNYGNLDSEIYLPHVIENMEREGLGAKEESKVRTLKVLFEFVRLSPQEILDLGKELNTPGRRPTEEEIAGTAEQKKERSVLLQSAGTELTARFREWWRQGTYRFRFEADGDHFRIWVADDLRPEEIELEGRSTGLQWFLSFYLIFLVESMDSHEDSILLLDEPGLSLHPLAQRDLSEFFCSLSETNQILYTTHSPFMVDPDALDRVKAVYVNDDGTTAVSSNLRASEGKIAQSRSIYPVYAALGLTISDTLLQGCQPVIVEGMSDQHYLSAIKTLLISSGKITPKRELVFIPGGGSKGIAAVVSIVAGAEEQVPYAILDSDAAGDRLAEQLRNGVYKGAGDRVVQVGDSIQIPAAEIEDLIPPDVMILIVDRWLRGNYYFNDVYVAGQPMVDQIEAFAAKQGVELEPGWKVELSKKVKERLLGSDVAKIGADHVAAWESLFGKLLQ